MRREPFSSKGPILIGAKTINQHPDSSTINLRRNARAFILLGILLLSVAVLILRSPGIVPNHTIVGVSYLLGGVASIFYINRLMIDVTSDQIVHQRGLLFPVFNKQYPISRVRKVQISKRVIRRNQKTKVTYPVRLSGIGDAIVSNHASPWFSRVIAEQLARRIKVPLDNRVYGVSSLRKSDELDTPLIRRWIHDRERLDEPVIPITTDLVEKRGPSSYEVSFSVEFPQAKYFVLLCFLVAGLALTDILPDDFFGSTAYRVIAGIAFFIGIICLSFVGRSKLKIDSGSVSFRQGYAPFTNKMRIEEIEEFVTSGDGVTMIGDSRAIWIHWTTTNSDSEYLVAIIPYELRRIGSKLYA